MPALLILVRQPDVGQTGLLLCLWGAMLFFWGMSFVWVGAGIGVAEKIIGKNGPHVLAKLSAHGRVTRV